MTARIGGEAYLRMGAGFRRFVGATPGHGNAAPVERFASLPALEAKPASGPVQSVGRSGREKAMVASSVAALPAGSRSRRYRTPILAAVALLLIGGIVVGSQHFDELVLLGIDGGEADRLDASAPRLSYPYILPYQPPTAEDRAISLAIAQTPAVLDEPLRFEALHLIPAGSLGVALATESDQPLQWRAPIMQAPPPIQPRVAEIPVERPRREVVEAPRPPRIVTPVRNTFTARAEDGGVPWDRDHVPRQNGGGRDD